MSWYSLFPRIIAEDMAVMSRMANEMARSPAALAQAVNFAKEPEVHSTDSEFRIRLNLEHFKPEDVKITSENQRLTISAKHEEKEDDHGYVAREILRTYKLPENVDVTSVTSSLNSNGILNINMQKKSVEEPKETPIPVDVK